MVDNKSTGGGRSPAKPVCAVKIPCQQGKCREFFKNPAISREYGSANTLRFLSGKMGA
jgi:hypothetical protein